jgi:hypothetical protein
MTTETVNPYWTDLTAKIAEGLRAAENFDDVWRTVPRGGAMTLAWAAIRRAINGNPGPWDSTSWLLSHTLLDQLQVLEKAADIAERLGAKSLLHGDAP